MSDINLPSGKKLVSLASAQKQMSATASGALKIDTTDKCPKCRKQMGIAAVGQETVFYCAPCRSCLPQLN